MIFVNTGYLVALADRRDRHRAAAMAGSAAASGLLLVGEYVLWETINALSSPAFRASTHDLAVTVRNSDAFQFVAASSQLLDRALAFHQRHHDSFRSLTDGASFSLMSERGITHAIAYDQHFEQAGFGAMMRQMPVD
jgi:predicted nucleic acid-binding protein